MFKKTTLKRSLSLVLALLLMLPVLMACAGEPDPPTETPVAVVENGASDYIIVYANSNADRALASTLSDAIKEKTGVKLKIYSDASQAASTEPKKEILIGSTNRAESTSVATTLRAKDYGISYANERVVIAGGSPNALEQAVTYFIDTYINDEANSVTVFKERNDLKKYNYPLGDLSISGTPITDYVIVYPTAADVITKYMAYNLSDYILTNAGVSVEVVTDSATPVANELLIGKTNRPESNAADGITLSDNQFVLVQNGKKVAMLGNSYMVGGAVSELVNVHFASKGINTAVDATTIPTTAAAKAFSFKTATSAILMIGDGMGFNHIESTEQSGKLDKFVAEYLPFQNSCTTISQTVIDEKNDSDPTTNTRYTDSAAAATALATGYKTLNSYLGLDAQGNRIQNVRELAHSTGAKTAVITTDKQTGATPSGFLCHHNSRNDAAILQGQIDALVAEQLVDYVYGGDVFTSDLIEHTREGLSVISEGNDKFFAMIEEAHIDKESHQGRLNGMQTALVRYHETIAYVIGFVMLHPYTSLIVTADHETGELLQIGGEWQYTYEDPEDTHDSTYYQHTDYEVPVFGLGAGLEELFAKDDFDNTDIGKYLASVFGDDNFGAN